MTHNGNKPKQWTKAEFAELEGTRQFATPAQVAAIDSLVKHGSIQAAAEALGITASRLRGALTEARRRGARRGFAPSHDLTHTVPDGQHVKGVSTYYGADGNVRGQWVKSHKDEDHKVQLLLDAMQSISEPFQGKSELVIEPRDTMSEIMSVYPMGDPHFGMYAWEAETGADFDLNIAETNLVAAVDHLVALAPPSDVGMIINLGDFFHTDTMKNQTARSANVLDVDTRWQKMLEVGIRTIRRNIDQALTKHKKVVVINAVGNHDEHTSIMLSVALSLYYENNERVHVDTTPNPFKYHEHGQCLIGVMHGDTTKPAQLPGIMATDRKEAWGRTSHRYWYCGHIHHDTVKEYPGPCTVETFRTLATKDAWHNKFGYRSGRDMKLDVLHAKHGRINRHIVGVEQLPWK